MCTAGTATPAPTQRESAARTHQNQRTENQKPGTYAHAATHTRHSSCTGTSIPGRKLRPLARGTVNNDRPYMRPLPRTRATLISRYMM
jgi:hypothetical protein